MEMQPLSPSEVVLLNGEQFAKRVGIMSSVLGNGREQLLRTNVKVSAVELAGSVLAASLLAAEKAGAVQLESRRVKGFLGRGHDELFVEPGDVEAGFPEGSLESRVQGLAKELQADEGKNKASQLVSSLLQETVDDPWLLPMKLVKTEMAERGLLEAESARLGFKLTPQTEALIERQPVAPVQELLSECQQQRPQIWKALDKSITRGVGSRRKREKVDSEPWEFDSSD